MTGQLAHAHCTLLCVQTGVHIGSDATTRNCVHGLY